MLPMAFDALAIRLILDGKHEQISTRIWLTE